MQIQMDSYHAQNVCVCQRERNIQTDSCVSSYKRNRLHSACTNPDGKSKSRKSMAPKSFHHFFIHLDSFLSCLRRGEGERENGRENDQHWWGVLLDTTSSLRLPAVICLIHPPIWAVFTLVKFPFDTHAFLCIIQTYRAELAPEE